MKQDRTNVYLALGAIGLTFLVLGILQLVGGYYIERIVIGIGINLILVISLNLANGFTGLFSLGHIGFMAIGAYASAILTLPLSLKATNLPDLPPFLAKVQMPFLPALLIGGLIAMLVAFLIGLSLMRLTGPYITVATMGFLVIVQVVLINWDSLTRGARTFAGVPEYTNVWNVWIWAIIVLYVVWRLKFSSFGRKMMAARDNEIAAKSLGVNVMASRLLAFCVSAFFTGVAGALWAHFITAFSPKSFYFSQTFSVITMLVVGGLGSLSGSVVGVLLITILSEVLRNAERGFSIGPLVIPEVYGASQVIMAILFVLFIVFRPRGLLGESEFDIKKFLSKARKGKEVTR